LLTSAIVLEAHVLWSRYSEVEGSQKAVTDNQSNSKPASYQAAPTAVASVNVGAKAQETQPIPADDSASKLKTQKNHPKKNTLQ
jgi:hypothetical protein